MFGEVTGWIVVPVIASLYGGRWLDEKYGTGNIFFLGLTAAAFIISCVGIALVGSKYLRQVEEQDKQKKDDGSDTTI